jgi:hypothetical protein
MGDAGGRGRRSGWLDRAAAAALAAAAVGALIGALRLGSACRAGGEDLLAELRAVTERRVATERAQIRPALDAASRGDWPAARLAAETELGRLDGNSQLHLLLADVYRAQDAPGPALREYRRAVELVRDYSDPRSPQFIGAALAPWMHKQRPTVSGEALGNLNYLARALAGGCS